MKEGSAMDAEKALATLATERGYIHTTPEKLARDLARDDWTLVPTVATGQQLVRLSDDLLAAEAEIARLRTALEKLRDLPAHHYRRNGFASSDPWVRQQDVARVARAALAESQR